MNGQRYHGLDALRGYALLLGVLLHAMMPFVLPPGLWAVGSAQPNLGLSWLTYYIHSFRMEVFFLLAGFFAALVIEKRGVALYLRDRAVRVLLVFLVALYPMKFLLTTLWIAGGRLTGWLPLPAEVTALPFWLISLGAMERESWPDINLTHLWFLYYLALVAAIFVGLRRLATASAAVAARAARLRSGVRHLLGSASAPLVLALATAPLLASMRGMDIDTPDSSFAWNWPVLALYLGGFALGFALHGADEVLAALGRRWRLFLIAGLAFSLPASILVGMRHTGGEWALAHADALRWLASAGTALTMWLAVLGWLGLFLARCRQPSPAWRYLADASYWIYLAHLPVLVALQVWWAPWTLAWWLELPLLLIVTLALLLPAYHWGVRSTWLGAWLNGRRVSPSPGPS